VTDGAVLSKRQKIKGARRKTKSARKKIKGARQKLIYEESL
jgi:hypothetical protein